MSSACSPCVALLALPFGVYRTFWLEQRFGFNRTTPAVFAADLAEGLGARPAARRRHRRLRALDHVGARPIVVVGGLARVDGLHARCSPGPGRGSSRRSSTSSRRSRTRPSVAHRRPARALRLPRQGRLRHGRLAAIVARQRLFHRARPREAHRVLRHPALAPGAAAGRVGAGARTRPLPAAARSAADARRRAGEPRRVRAARLAREAAWFYSALGVPAASDAAALLLFVLVAPSFTWLLTPVGAAWSRRHEFQADAFAARYSDAGSLADALVALYQRQCQHAHAGPDPLGLLRFAPAAGRPDRAAECRLRPAPARTRRSLVSDRDATGCVVESYGRRVVVELVRRRDGALQAARPQARRRGRRRGARRAARRAPTTGPWSERLPRRNLLSRSDSRGLEESIAANLDQLGIVVAARAGLRPVHRRPLRRGRLLRRNRAAARS